MRIDFAPRNAYSALSRAQWALLALPGLIALLTAGFCLDAALTLRELRAQNQSLDAAHAGLAAAAQRPSISPEQQSSAEAAIRALNTPWPQLLAALQQNRPAAVALLSLESQPEQHSIRIVAEAQQAADLFDFLDGLQKNPLVRRVAPLLQERIEAAHYPLARQRLTFEMEWR